MKDSRTPPMKLRTLIEDWLPIKAVGCESMRERGASSALPPLYFLHVWWARRPLLASRAALLASVLPAWSHLAPEPQSGATDRNSDDEPTKNADRGLASDRNDRMRIHEGRERGPETSAEPSPCVVGQTAAHGQPGGVAGQRTADVDRKSGTILERERERELPFRSAEEYEEWFVRLCGIFGDPVAGRKKIQWAKQQGIRLKDPPYTHKRAFTVNPTGDQLRILEDLLQHAWGKDRLSVLDPFAGGGSIPFEAVRYGFDTSANELNPVAGAILRGTLEYPFAYGASLTADTRRWGKRLTHRLRKALSPYYPEEAAGSVHAYIWARTVACPYTGKLVPLAPNWWLARSGAKGKAILPAFEENAARAMFRVVEIEDGAGPDGFDPGHGTVRRGRGRSPWASDQAIEGDYIKAEAQAGRMGSQLYCVAVKKPRGGFDYRPPNDEEMEAVEKAEAELARKLPLWDARGWVPTEPYPEASSDPRPLRFGMPTWSDMFSPRQLLALCSYVEALHELVPEIESELPKDRAKAVVTYLGMVLSKAVNYNSYLASWDPTRTKIRGVFDRHDFSFKWTYGEFDASRNLFPWGLDQVCDAYKGLATLAEPAHRVFRQAAAPVPVRVTRASASDLSHVPDGSIDVVLTDPPYYDNVMYGELSDFFYVWLKRTLGRVHPDLFADDLANKDDEAVANPARFASMGRKRKQLAAADYERKMAASFREARRALTDDGVLTVMFTHKKVEAWDTLAMSLLEAGFAIHSSWPVHTESEHGLHQAKKNAALSTILLTCRKRPKPPSPHGGTTSGAECAGRPARRPRNFRTRASPAWTSTSPPSVPHWPSCRSLGPSSPPKSMRRRANRSVSARMSRWT